MKNGDRHLFLLQGQERNRWPSPFIHSRRTTELVSDPAFERSIRPPISPDKGVNVFGKRDQPGHWTDRNWPWPKTKIGSSMNMVGHARHSSCPSEKGSACLGQSAAVITVGLSVGDEVFVGKNLGQIRHLVPHRLCFLEIGTLFHITFCA